VQLTFFHINLVDRFEWRAETKTDEKLIVGTIAKLKEFHGKYKSPLKKKLVLINVIGSLRHATRPYQRTNGEVVFNSNERLNEFAAQGFLYFTEALIICDFMENHVPPNTRLAPHRFKYCRRMAIYGNEDWFDKFMAKMAPMRYFKHLEKIEFWVPPGFLEMPRLSGDQRMLFSAIYSLLKVKAYHLIEKRKVPMNVTSELNIVN
jgi:hypothetical protein